MLQHIAAVIVPFAIFARNLVWELATFKRIIRDHDKKMKYISLTQMPPIHGLSILSNLHLLKVENSQRFSLCCRTDSVCHVGRIKLYNNYNMLQLLSFLSSYTSHESHSIVTALAGRRRAERARPALPWRASIARSVCCHRRSSVSFQSAASDVHVRVGSSECALLN